MDYCNNEGLHDKCDDTMKMFHEILIAVDQLGNALLGGWADETFSARCYRMSLQSKYWKVAEVLLNTIMLSKTHCKDAYHGEQWRDNSPPELRPKV
jgi:hypothetical protein